MQRTDMKGRHSLGLPQVLGPRICNTHLGYILLSYVKFLFQDDIFIFSTVDDYNQKYGTVTYKKRVPLSTYYYQSGNHHQMGITPDVEYPIDYYMMNSLRIDFFKVVFWGP